MNPAWQTLCPGCFTDKGNQTTCPHCGYDEAAARGPLPLAHRTLLHGQFLVGRVLGKPGGFGVTYLAYDTGLETLVAVKEYLPRDLAGREAGQTFVCAHSREDGELFRFGLEQFLQEARTLAKFDHAHLVRVRHVFEGNGTAYLVMDYYQGVTLAEYLDQKGPLPEQTAVAILNPILDGLREVHAKGFIHRDIKPQNIYLTAQGRPILLDFGAARLAMAERSRSLSVVLSAGYAPFEQYSRRGEQGSWTDVYACAAVLYQMLTGQAPPEATDRVDEDILLPPQTIVPDVSAQLADVLVKGLALRPKQRYQSIREFQDALLLPAESEAASKARPADVTASGDRQSPQQPRVLPPKRQEPLRFKIKTLLSEQPSDSETARSKQILTIMLGVFVLFVLILRLDIRLEESSIDWIRLKAEIGFTEAQYTLGLKYENGQGVVQDDAEALKWYRLAAKNGDPSAQINLGLMYANGTGVAKDDAQAVAWYRKAAEQGDALGQYNLGVMYANGIGVAKDDAQAVAWYRKAAAQGNADAQNNLGLMYDNGTGVAEDDAQAVEWYRKAAEQGNALGQYNLGLMYANGTGVAEDDAEAVNWYRKAAGQGNALAQNDLGFMYGNGMGVKEDQAEAVAWYRKAAAQQNALGQYNLGLMYDNGSGVAEDDTKAVAWYRKAATQGNADAQNNLGLMYDNGTGVAEDDAQAVEWYRKAAEQGNALGQYHLGVMYANGTGVAEDDAEAVNWYRKAAGQGNALAQNDLGFMYGNGMGVKKDRVEAVAWYQKAAEQGLAIAQFNLGVMYQDGLGVAKNTAVAINWYRKAAAQGYADAKTALHKLKAAH